MMQIKAEIINTTDSITLHMGNLEIIKSQVTINGTHVISNGRRYDNTTEKYTFMLSETPKQGTIVEIFFLYEGKFADNMIGFYKSSYVGENGEIK